MASTPLPGSFSALATPTQPHPTVVEPRAAARAAAEARATLPPADSPSAPGQAHSPSLPFNPSVADKLPFHRLLDTEILPKTGKQQATKTLETLVQLTSNILNPPNPANAPKYRQIRLANTGVKKNIIDITGAYEYLVACGFRHTTTNFEEFLTFSSSPSPKLLHSLKSGHYVLSQQAERVRAAAEREVRMREAEIEQEKARVGKALLGFEEDRRLKREKDERDKIVREARAQKEAEAAALAAEHANNPLFSGPTDAASTMQVDIGADAPPPSYGELHGRVLGTGEAVAVPAPAGVRMYSDQDNFTDDDEDV